MLQQAHVPRAPASRYCISRKVALFNIGIIMVAMPAPVAMEALRMEADAAALNGMLVAMRAMVVMLVVVVVVAVAVAVAAVLVVVWMR